MQEDINITKRVLQLNKIPYQDGPVLYWMNRDCRAEDNFALLYAQSIALKEKVPLIVLYNLVPKFLGGTYRNHAFKVEGLQEVERNLAKKQISFFVVEGADTEKQIISFIKKHKCGALVTDFSPLKIALGWKKYIEQRIDIPFYIVDTHNIVPAWIASTKREFGAYTLRPKLHKLLPLFLLEIPLLKKHSYPYKNTEHINWEKLLDKKEFNDATNIAIQKPGSKEAHKVLQSFVKERLKDFGLNRNDPTKDGGSRLSAYLHYGQISPQRVVLEVLKHKNKTIEQVVQKQRKNAKEKSDSLCAFIEELVVRRELADNFCFYNPHYDTFKGFPDWAQNTLNETREDKREYIYSKKQFEAARTHDDLWNAAQREMVKTGKMHGYMRMYWAKKILEWSKSPEDALAIAIYLNDKYELDGRDPNGYAGIAWSIGGTHDRAWFPRKVFGLVRFMARSGCEKKFDVKKYIQMYS